MSSIRAVTLATLLIATGSAMHAQQTAGLTGCEYRFTQGVFSWCASANGNLIDLGSSGQEHIGVGKLLEGYAVCVPGLGPYYDMGAVANGWAAAELIAPPGAAAAFSIRRTTLDGRFTLVQDFVGRSDRSVTIGMSLTNNEEPLPDVRILRSADLDIDGTFRGDVFDRSADSVWARQINAVTLLVLNPTISHETRVSINTAPRTCTPTAVSSLPATGDLAGSIRYNLGAMQTGQTKIVRVRYHIQ